MKPELIVMLTHNDKTVENAFELFEQSLEIPVKHWGFKDVGLSKEKMGKLVRRMKDAEKTTYLEVVSLSEAEGLSGAKIAVDSGFDVLMGTVYYPSIQKYLAGKPIAYYPFPGKIVGHPSVLEGSIEEIVNHAIELQEKGVQGLDLLAYRYTGDARRLLGEVVKAIKIPLVSAGSVASTQRIAEIWQTGAWGYTIGGAFFEGKFAPKGDFTENLRIVCEWMEKADEQHLPEYLA